MSGSSIVSGGLGGAASGASIGSVVPGIGTALGAISGGILGGIAGLFGGGGGPSPEEIAANENIKQIEALPIPDEQKLKLSYQYLKSQGVYTPAMQSYEQLGPTEFAKIQTNPQYQQAKLDAISGLQNRANSGLTIQDLVDNNQLTAEANRAGQARNDSILQQRAQRGQLGSGDELAAQLANSQAATQQQSDAASKLAAQTQAAKMQAIQNLGSMASQFDTSDFNKQAQVASAKDTIAKYNNLLANQTAQANTAAKNTAQQTNLQNAQDLANKNVGLYNEQNRYNAQVPMQTYNAQVNKFNTIANLRNNKAAAQSNSNANNASGFGEIMKGVGSVASGIAGGIKSENDSGNSNTISDGEYDDLNRDSRRSLKEDQ